MAGISIERFEVSQSKVKKWLQCRMAYHLRYVDGLTAKVKGRPLVFGGLIHEMLEKWTEGEDPFEYLDKVASEQSNLFAAERESYGEIVEDARVIMNGYFDYWKREKLYFVKVGGKRSEHWMEVDLGDQLRLVMKLDGIVRTPNKLRWLLENKTGKTIPEEDQRWRDLQTAVYLRACEMLGIKKLTGVMWNYIRSKPPVRPQILQSGGLSARQIETMPATVMQVIRDNNLDPGDYKTLLERAEQTAGNWFRRVFTPINQSVVDAVFDDFVSTANEIADNHGKCCQRNIGRHCSWCDYELICRTELTGGDVDFAKESSYDNKEDRDEKEKREQRKAAAKKKRPRGRKGRTSNPSSK
jgi:hypothetical protein